eukprot:360917-Chlamydomonas_euryale.AAC.6
MTATSQSGSPLPPSSSSLLLRDGRCPGCAPGSWLGGGPRCWPSCVPGGGPGAEPLLTFGGGGARAGGGLGGSMSPGIGSGACSTMSAGRPGRAPPSSVGACAAIVTLVPTSPNHENDGKKTFPGIPGAGPTPPCASYSAGSGTSSDSTCQPCMPGFASSFKMRPSASGLMPRYALSVTPCRIRRYTCGGRGDGGEEGGGESLARVERLMGKGRELARVGTKFCARVLCTPAWMDGGGRGACEPAAARNVDGVLASRRPQAMLTGCLQAGG